MRRSRQGRFKTASSIVRGVNANDPDLDGKFISMYSKLRGHDEYWSTRRGELKAMVQFFGKGYYLI
jgi:hypothetical protein